MRNLANKRARILSVMEKYSGYYQYNNSEEKVLITSGVLNFIWNQWNNFWRDYWLAHVTGGIDLDKSIINPIFPNYTDKQGCHYLLFACGKRNNHTPGASIAGNYQEVSWGDPRKMTNILSTISNHHGHLNFIQSLIGIYQTKIEHFQRIRNSFIHLNNENIYHLNSISGYYSFEPNQKIIDILESKDLSNSIRCYDSLINSMLGMIKNL